MTPLEEARYIKKKEAELRGHRGLQNGRDFRWNTERFQQRSGDIDQRFDDTFPDAPGSPDAINNKYCSCCDKLISWCECHEKEPSMKKVIGKRKCAREECDNQFEIIDGTVRDFCSKECRLLARSKKGERIVRRMHRKEFANERA